MKRFHVHVAVTDLATNVRFYSSLFGAEPSVLKDDYAKWMLDDPCINFAISARGAAVGVNHLGIQVNSEDDLEVVHGRMASADAPVVDQAATTCCYAVSNKHWVTDPQGIAWEAYHTLDSAPTFGTSIDLQAATQATATPASGGGCCGPAKPVAPTAPVVVAKSGGCCSA